MHSRLPRRGFTLIELLVVIAIIAILAVVVVLTLNPSELLRQSRDSNRVSDMDTLTHAITLYISDLGGSQTFSLGNASSVYISLPDPTISGAATSTCTYWNLPALPAGYNYQCASPQDFKNVNGTGWIPVNFSGMSTGAPIGSLPVDPVNTSSTGLYYAYSVSSSQYEVTSLFESQKYKAQFGQNPLDPAYPEVDAKGSSVSISPLFNTSGLVGYWPLSEGSGTLAYDQSGGGSTGNWNGNVSGTNGYYSAGKVGTYGGFYDGSTDYTDVSNQTPFNFGTGNFSIVVWVYPNTSGSNRMVVQKGGYAVGGYVLWIDNGQNVNLYTYDTIGATLIVSSNPLPVNAWSQIAVSVNRSGSSTIAINGVPQTVSGSVRPGNLNVATDLQFGHSSPAISFYSGIIDDIHIYNRAISNAEIQAIYDAEK